MGVLLFFGFIGLVIGLIMLGSMDEASNQSHNRNSVEHIKSIQKSLKRNEDEITRLKTIINSEQRKKRTHTTQSKSSVSQSNVHNINSQMKKNEQELERLRSFIKNTGNSTSNVKQKAKQIYSTPKATYNKSSSKVTNIGSRSRRWRLKLEEAISRGLSVDIDYINANETQSTRTIKPSKIFKINDKLCVKGFCELREENRTFALRRIQDLKINYSTNSFQASRNTRDVSDIFYSSQLEVIDKRSKNGCLWVIVGSNKYRKKEFEMLCEKHNLKPKFAKNGSKSTKHRAAYYFPKAA